MAAGLCCSPARVQRGQHLLADLGERDLAVSVGGIIPGSNIQVDAVTDLASLLDALVTLRSYAQRAVA